MAKVDMLDHIYDNTSWMKNNTSKVKKSGTKKRCYIDVIYVGVVGVLILSLLANVGLACLYFMKDYIWFLHCEPRNCSNSEGNPSCKHEELFNYCPDLPEQWVKGNGSLYVFSSFNKTWNSSRKHCQSHGGDLVIINNTEEKEFLAQRLCITGESNLYWTGTSGGNWKVQEQINCATLKENTQGDAFCSRKERSICEIPCF